MLKTKIFIGTPGSCEQRINAMRETHHICVVGYAMSDGVVSVILDVSEIPADNDSK